jgi:hypothetical protein
LALAEVGEVAPIITQKMGVEVAPVGVPQEVPAPQELVVAPPEETGVRKLPEGQVVGPLRPWENRVKSTVLTSEGTVDPIMPQVHRGAAVPVGTLVEVPVDQMSPMLVVPVEVEAQGISVAVEVEEAQPVRLVAGVEEVLITLEV